MEAQFTPETVDAFRLIVADIQARWHAFMIPQTGKDQYLFDLGDIEPRKVAVAVDALHVTGIDGRLLNRAPTPGEVRRKVAELDMDAPSWDDVRTALVRWRREAPARRERMAARVCPVGACDGKGIVADKVNNTSWDCECRPAYMVEKRGYDMLPALVVEFVSDGHVDVRELERFLDEADGDTEARVRNRWREFSGRAVDARVLAGLPDTAGMAQLEAARAEDRERFERREGDLRKMSAVALLEQGSQA